MADSEPTLDGTGGDGEDGEDWPVVVASPGAPLPGEPVPGDGDGHGDGLAEVEAEGEGEVPTDVQVVDVSIEVEGTVVEVAVALDVAVDPDGGAVDVEVGVVDVAVSLESERTSAEPSDPEPGVAEDDDDPLVVGAVPSVVAVVVARNPGLWFEGNVASLADQAYPNLALLVIDCASTLDPSGRLAEVAPDAYIRRLDVDVGYGPAANNALGMVEGAAFLLVCRDTVSLHPGAVQALVEEAYRSNGGILAPKLVRHDDPSRLVAVGYNVDKFAVAGSVVEPGELDQEQHDAVRDVFAVPGDCFLIRSDLFSTLGGFAPDLAEYGDDVDLCWRAHVAGARVMVVPDAVASVEATARRAGPASKVVARNRLRTVLSNYGVMHSARVVPQAALLGVLDVIAGVVSGRARRIGDVVSAWTWALRHGGSIRRARRRVRSVRHVGDADVRRLQVGGSVRITSFVRRRLGGDAVGSSALSAAGRDLVAAVRSGSRRSTLVTWAGFLTVVVFGSRHLLTRGVPNVRELSTISGPGLDHLAHYVSGWGPTTLGSADAAPSSLAWLGALTVAAFGQGGLLGTALAVGPIVVGGLGAWRLLRRTGSTRVRAAALIAYGANPVPYDSLSEGRWQALLVYAALPWLLAALAAGSIPGLPFSPGPPEGVDPNITSRAQRSQPERKVVASVLGLGLLLALVVPLAPSAAPLLVLLVAGLVVGSLLSGSARGAGRTLVVGLGGLVVCAAIHLPWVVSLVNGGQGWRTAVGARPSVDDTVRFLDVVGFGTGRVGGSAFTAGLVVSGVLPLLIGRDWRFRWAVRGWVLAIAAWVLAWLSDRGDLPFDMPASEVVLTLAALGIAVAVAMGAAAFETDLVGYRFGWRQLLSVAAVVAVVLSVGPVTGASFDGRWHLPREDLASVVGALDDGAPTRFRTVWLGHPDDLPLASWDLAEGLGLALTDGATPSAVDLFPGPRAGGAEALSQAVLAALDGETNRLGRVLAPFGVRYIVVSDRSAPAPFAPEGSSVPPGVDERLSEQLDLETIELNPTVRVYQNTAFLPERWEIPVDDLPPADTLARAVRADLSAARPVMSADSLTSAAGAVDDDVVAHHAATAADGWSLEVDGRQAEQVSAFGWSDGYEVIDGGNATMSYRPPASRWLLVAGQVLALVLVLAVRARRRDDSNSEAPLDLARAVPAPPTGATLGRPAQDGPDPWGLHRRWRPESAIQGEDDW